MHSAFQEQKEPNPKSYLTLLFWLCAFPCLLSYKSLLVSCYKTSRFIAWSFGSHWDILKLFIYLWGQMCCFSRWKPEALGRKAKGFFLMVLRRLSAAIRCHHLPNSSGSCTKQSRCSAVTGQVGWTSLQCGFSDASLQRTSWGQTCMATKYVITSRWMGCVMWSFFPKLHHSSMKLWRMMLKPTALMVSV